MIRHCLLSLLCVLATSPAMAATPPAPEPASPAVTDAASVDRAIDRGLAFLARQQAPDGAFEATGPRLATCALSFMSFLAAGHTPDVGRYGLVVRQATDCLVREAPEDG